MIANGETLLTEVIKISKPSKKNLSIAANAIREGKIVVFPTETVYGIGANALDEEASRRIFEIKGREGDNPLIVHVSSIEMAERIAEIPREYKSAIEKVWPAPLTLILKSRSRVAPSVTAGLDTVAVRMPAHDVALALIRESGVPIAAPSANLSKKPSSTAAAHALSYFDGKVDIIIDSGRSAYGLESTVLDLEEFKVLRPGAFTPDDIKEIFGSVPSIESETFEKPKSPGTKYRHYSPSTPLFLSEVEVKELASILKDFGRSYDIGFIGSSDSCKRLRRYAKHRISLGRSDDLYSIASNLFDALIKIDEKGVDFTVIEGFEERGIGIAIMNRIKKASDHRKFSNVSELEMLVRHLPGC